jgi:hypothetical protein
LRSPARKRVVRLRSFRAVELYGDAVVQADDHKKHELLQLALGEDPELTYAAHDLAELEKRMSGYAQVASSRASAAERAQLQRLTDGKLAPGERVQAAHALLTAMVAARRYHALAEAATQLSTHKELREEASFHLFRARDGLHAWDLALQAGEQYLREQPTGPHFREVETRMHEIVEARKKLDARRGEYQADLQEKLRGSKPGSIESDFAPCIAARWNSQLNELMLDGCRAYLARRGKDPDPDAREHALAARFFIVLALAEQGDFAQAKPLAEQLLADSDAWDEELRQLEASWPTD